MSDEEVVIVASAKSKGKARAKQPRLTQYKEPSPDVQDDIDVSIFDPNQDRGVVRKVRQEYRTIQDEMKSLNKDVKGTAVSSVMALLDRAENNFSSVKQTGEAVMDAALLNSMGQYTIQKARELKIGSEAFDCDAYVDCLAQLIGPSTTSNGRKRRKVAAGASRERARLESENESDESDGGDPVASQVDVADSWDRIGAMALQHTSRVPTIDFLLGAIATEHKKRIVKQRTRETKIDESERQKPQELSSRDVKRTKNETGTNVELIAQLIMRRQAAGLRTTYWELVCHPASFNQTVENIFYVSFLLRDGKFSLDYDDDEPNELYIMQCEEATDQDRADGVTRIQHVLEWDMNLWKMAIKAYDIREPIIPTRSAEVEENTKEGWHV
ncbi:uncharacterized protein L969DRAFT_43448 [Mixia osmundae IAM 14324]|uniref:Non-structural maintenance of chromosomes element 4 n=1 Tax=Mixia osmundae (strain CBS 9802 / IAM 14324 / JCM 22182 / KY 12970) TaxID=764103 RepID=G7E2X8_MIXOS|nr:uncharacterized protein L969DRAFT_43448 [Mixia osmundae IAM 14324]KEI42553.1 hypothetical protein L969DRAFT_43448 [Mixia osmundae IAM 14324]GAA97159.1 hypothetical protein E5Q_03835 [Mixia osmundae IAM 14324]